LTRWHKAIRRPVDRRTVGNRCSRCSRLSNLRPHNSYLSSYLPAANRPGAV
jgi:hypothetical protein